jgi:hypothetical protein
MSAKEVSELMKYIGSLGEMIEKAISDGHNMVNPMSLVVEGEVTPLSDNEMQKVLDVALFLGLSVGTDSGLVFWNKERRGATK